MNLPGSRQDRRRRWPRPGPRAASLGALIAVAIAVALGAATDVLAQGNERGVDIWVTAGEEFTRTVAIFEDASGTSTAADYVGSVDWGDGSPRTAGVIVQAPSCPGRGICFEVRGTHSYGAAGSFGLFVAVASATEPELLFAVQATATVRDYSGVDISVAAGEEFTRTVATFRDPGGTTAEDFSATIGWGDGSASTAGAIVQLRSCPSEVELICYEVRGTHTYQTPGERTITINVSGPGAPDPVSVTAKATVTAPPRPPLPEPQRPPAAGSAGPVAQIALVDSEVRTGEPAIVDASRSSGQIELFAFDLNGNGTYETQSASPFASVVHTVPGPKRVGIQVTGSDGKTATTAATLNVASGAITAPAGQRSLLPGTVVASPHASVSEALRDAVIKDYTCPVTVQVGVAEATISQEKVFPPTLGEPCFERVTKPATSGGFYLADEYPRFVAGKEYVRLNGLDIDTRPNPNAGDNPLVIYEKKKIVTQKVPGHGEVVMRLQKGGIGTIISEWFSFGTWNVASPGMVGTFPIEDFFGPTMMGLPVVSKESPIKFSADHRSELQVFVVPPFDPSSLGASNSPTGQAPLTLRADNTDGLQVEGSIVATGGKYQLDLPLGIFHLKGTLSYSQEGGSHVWSGDVSLSIPDTPVDNINAKIRFKDGKLEQATVSVPFKRPGLGPIGCCIYLVGLEGKLTTSAIEATATFAAGPELIGDFRAAEAKATVTWYFSPFMLAFKADELRIASFPVNANTHVAITKNHFLALAFWDSDFGPFSHKVNVEVRIGQPWYVAGGGSACFEVFIKGCTSVYGAAGPQGIAACGTVAKVLTGGVRVPWNPVNLSDWSGWWGCSFDLVKAKVSAARAAAIRGTAEAAGATVAAASYPVRIPPGLRGALFVIDGRGAQPHVSLRAPDGTEIITPAPGVSRSEGRNWLAMRDTTDDSVHVVVVKPAAGRWTVRELPGSPAVRSVGFAEALPTRFTMGTVSGRGRTRTLHYRVARAAGTRVTFVERGGDPASQDPERRVEQTIGRATGAKGEIRFTPSEAKVRQRRIEALIESQGAVIRTERVAGFTAPPFGLPAAPRVTVRRVKRALVARWSAVAGARAYQVFVNQSDGQTRYFRQPARRRSVRVAGINGLSSAAVEVLAVSEAGYIGKPGRASLRALGPFQVSPRQRLAAVLRARGFSARCIAAGDGRCEVTVAKGGRSLARGARRLRRGESGRVSVRLTPAGTNALLAARRSGRALSATLVPIVPGVGVRNLRITFG